LTQDGKEEVAKYFKAHHSMLTKGLYWADKGWKNVKPIPGQEEENARFVQRIGA